MSDPIKTKELVKNGLWTNNIVLAQLLALCPLLAVTNGATNGLGLGLATTFVMVAANFLTSLSRHYISRAIRIPMNILIIATLVTMTDLILHAYLAALHQVLGLFIPLIVTNCAILGRVEAFATKQTSMKSVVDGASMGIGFTWVLVVLGGIREILGTGKVFDNAALLLGPHFAFLETTVVNNFDGLLIAILPPGGFFVLGGMLCIKQKFTSMISQRQTNVSEGASYES
ncbi:electron transport complex subunit E [Vibrio agarivorans]|uniref:electron transport complex subunit E n=1 Tax=Vibrio agarivorans TaxID=153622 RepID=UPI002232C5AE|nr:electron transport complex subunit E [Vibrio agarivorans]